MVLVWCVGYSGTSGQRMWDSELKRDRLCLTTGHAQTGVFARCACAVVRQRPDHASTRCPTTASSGIPLVMCESTFSNFESNREFFFRIEYLAFRFWIKSNQNFSRQNLCQKVHFEVEKLYNKRNVDEESEKLTDKVPKSVNKTLLPRVAGSWLRNENDCLCTFQSFLFGRPVWWSNRIAADLIRFGFESFAYH